MAISVIVHGARPCPEPDKRRITFDTPRIVIGRASSSDVRLPDASVSPRHLTIQQRGNRFAIVDEGSTNGTFVGRAKLSPKAPQVVDQRAFVRAGRFVLEISIGPGNASAQPAAVAKELALGLVIDRLLEEGEDARPQLLVESGPDAGAALVLEPGEPAVIGRSREAELALTDAGASRRHVEVLWRGDGIVVRDLGSKSGSELGDRILGSASTPWREGEKLLIGDTVIGRAFDAPEALSEIERAPDEKFATADIDLSPFEPEPEPEESDALEAEPAEAAPSDEETPTPEETEEAAALAARSRGATWSMTDIAVVLLALGVFSLSAVGYFVLLR